MTAVTAVSVERRLRVPNIDLVSMDDEVRELVDAAWRAAGERSAFIGGEAVRAFESSWAERCGRRFAVGVANGTDAIALSLRASGVGTGDEVVVPANTFIATAEAVLMAGATPRFVDVDDATHLIDLASAETAIGPRTRAVVSVDLHGNVPDMDAVTAFAAAHDLVLIEDAAQAHGAMWYGRPAGSFGAASCFSFYPAKNLGAFGDAGAVVTDDEEIAARIRSIANHGRAADSANLHVAVGINSRLDALQAAVLSAKLTRLDAWNARRRHIAERYDAALTPLGEAAEPLRPGPGVVASYHHYIVRTPLRDRLKTELAAAGIETAIHYPIPCHLQEPYRTIAPAHLPVAEALAAEILSLPMFPHMTDDQVDLVCDMVSRTVTGGMRAR
jgi:dTDP-4-amino-4,6-dideoxygalactose transaminase